MASNRENGKNSAASRLIVAASSSVAAIGDVRAAKQEWSARLLAPAAASAASVGRHRRLGARARGAALTTAAPNDNVVGVGVAEKLVDGKSTGILCVKFFVRVKYAKSHLSAAERLPETVNGIAVDVEEAGIFTKFATRTKVDRGGRRVPTAAKKKTATSLPNPQTRIRPAQPGSSIGFADPAGGFIMAGTFGALVRRNKGTFVLSNNHVLADENQLPLGSAIFQPGLLDKGNPATDQIAALSQFVALQAGVNNKVDAAIAEVTEANLVSRDILHIGPPQGTTTALRDMVVHKFGRTTSYTAGRITSIDTDVSVAYDTGTFTFEEQIIIKGLNNVSFSDAGDSGSLILERGTQLAVGLLFAGSKAFTIANHIGDVLAEFGGITLA